MQFLYVLLLFGLTLCFALDKNPLDDHSPLEIPVSLKCGILNLHGNATRPFRIVMSTTEDYLPVLLNWLIFYHQFCPDRSILYFVCFDQKTALAMNRYGLECSYIHSGVKGGANKLWLERAKITLRLMEHGYDVLMCDSDAYWINNPFLQLQAYVHQGADIIGSRGEFPEEVAKRLGSAFCMGFFYMRSNYMMQLLWKYVITMLKKSMRPDDQKTINRVLMESGLRYLKRPHMTFEKDVTGYFGLKRRIQYDAEDTKSKLRGHRKYMMQVVSLSSQSYRRHCEGLGMAKIANSTVLHCLTKYKRGQSKFELSRGLGIWVISDQWDTHVVSNSKDQNGNLSYKAPAKPSVWALLDSGKGVTEGRREYATSKSKYDNMTLIHHSNTGDFLNHIVDFDAIKASFIGRKVFKTALKAKDIFALYGDMSQHTSLFKQFEQSIEHGGGSDADNVMIRTQMELREQKGLNNEGEDTLSTPSTDALVAGTDTVNEEDVETNRDIQQSRQVFRGVEETRGKEYVKEELKKEGMKIFSIVSTDKNQDGRGRGASAGSRGNKLSRVNNYKRKQKESKTYGSNKADRG